MIKYDISKFKKDNMECGRFKEGSILEKIGANSIGYISEISGERLGFFSIYRYKTETKRHSISVHFDIDITQDGVNLSSIFVRPKNKEAEYLKKEMQKIANIIYELRTELEKYKFVPYSWVKFSDEGVKYYYPDDRRYMSKNSGLALEEDNAKQTY